MAHASLLSLPQGATSSMALSYHPAAQPEVSTLATALVLLRNTAPMPSTSPQTQSIRLLLQGPQAGLAQ